jgi:hypothetical protein
MPEKRDDEVPDPESTGDFQQTGPMSWTSAPPVFHMQFTSLMPGIVGAGAKQATDFAESGRLEHAKMRTAIDEAIRMGIIREEILPSLRQTEKRAYLLASSHFDAVDQNPEIVPADAKQSQIELFQLLYLMRKQGLTSPLRLEGVTDGRARAPSLPIPGTDPPVPLADPTAQEAFFRNPQDLLPVIDAMLRVPNGPKPFFYRLAPYPIEGLQQPQTTARTNALIDRLSRSYAFNQLLQRVKGAFAIGTEIRSLWTKDGWHLVFANGYAISAAYMAQEAQAHLETMQEWSEVDAQRDNDSVAFLRHTLSPNIPLAWTGAAHVLPVGNQLRQDMHVHILRTASTDAFDARAHADQATRDEIREIPLARDLLQIARQLSAQRRPTP